MTSPISNSTHPVVAHDLPEGSLTLGLGSDDTYEEQNASDASAAAATAAKTPVSPNLPEFLTPQSLVAYCDCRLESLDSQMQTIFNQEQTAANVTNAVNQIASDYNDLPASTGSSSNPTVSVTTAQASQIQSDYQSAIETAKKGGSPQLASELQKDLETWQSNFTDSPVTSVTTVRFGENSKTWNVAASAITNLTQNLKTDSSDLDSDSQMSMINLQSLMSQQQTAVELSTNLMQTMSETVQDIAANLKA